MFEVGNPGGPGRPKKGQTFKEILEQELSKLKREVEDPETRQRVVVDARTIICRQMVLRAVKGDKSDVDRIMNRIDGTPAETIQFQGGGELKIKFIQTTEEDLRASENVEVSDGGEATGAGQGPEEADRAGGPGAGSAGT